MRKGSRPGQGGAQDAEPGERGKARLGALEHGADRDRPGRDFGDLVEEVPDPIGDRHAQQVEHGEQQGHADKPGGDSQEAARKRLPLAASGSLGVGFHGGTLANRSSPPAVLTAKIAACAPPGARRPCHC